MKKQNRTRSSHETLTLPPKKSFAYLGRKIMSFEEICTTKKIRKKNVGLKELNISHLLLAGFRFRLFGRPCFEENTAHCMYKPFSFFQYAKPFGSLQMFSRIYSTAQAGNTPWCHLQVVLLEGILNIGVLE